MSVFTRGGPLFYGAALHSGDQRFPSVDHAFARQADGVATVDEQRRPACDGERYGSRVAVLK